MRTEHRHGADVSQQEIANPASCNCLPRKRTLTYTQRITYAATLTAIALVIKIVVQQIFSFMPANRPTVIYVPWAIAGIILDPVSAAIVGFASDYLGMIIGGGGFSINPILSLSNTLFPCIISLCVRFLPFKKVPLNALIGVVISTVVCTMGLSTVGLYFARGLNIGDENLHKFMTFFITERLWQLLFILISVSIVAALLPVMKRLRLLPDRTEKSLEIEQKTEPEAEKNLEIENEKNIE